MWWASTSRSSRRCGPATTGEPTACCRRTWMRRPGDCRCPRRPSPTRRARAPSPADLGKRGSEYASEERVAGSLLAVLGGLGAAVCFTVSALCASSSSQEARAELTLAWVMLIGLVLVVPPTAVLADPAQLSPTGLALPAAARG